MPHGGDFRPNSANQVARLACGRPALGVRPDDLMLDPKSTTGTSGRVAVIELLGPRAIVQVNGSGQSLTAVVEASRMDGIVEGAEVEISIREGSHHLFDTTTGLRI